MTSPLHPTDSATSGDKGALKDGFCPSFIEAGHRTALVLLAFSFISALTTAKHQLTGEGLGLLGHLPSL